jgi:hypothetical protein
MNIYVLKVNLKEAEYGGYKFIEPERTVLELASDDKMKFVQKVVDLFRENLLVSMAMAENTYRQDVNGKKVDGENKFEDLLRLLEKKMIESASEVDSKNDDIKVSWWDFSNWSGSTATISIYAVEVV